jgi:hypothetical protein
MKKRTFVGVSAAIFFLVTAGCAALGPAGHKYFMKGQILEVSDSQAYLCIGSAEGAKAGQEFPVYRYERASAGKPPPTYKRNHVGAVRITQVVDEHFANAVVLKGDIKAHDIAELNR